MFVTANYVCKAIMPSGRTSECSDQKIKKSDL